MTGREARGTVLAPESDHQIHQRGAQAARIHKVPVEDMLEKLITAATSLNAGPQQHEPKAAEAAARHVSLHLHHFRHFKSSHF